jgi:hypothetical protein
MVNKIPPERPGESNATGRLVCSSQTKAMAAGTATLRGSRLVIDARPDNPGHVLGGNGILQLTTWQPEQAAPFPENRFP